jgi:hypothetical protein
MAVPVTPKIKGTTLQQLLIGRRGWAGFNVDPDTAALSMFDPDGEVTLEQIRAAIGGGGFTSVANIYVAWDAPPGGDGTVGKPFQTIQEGTDKAVAQQAVTASVVFVAAGRYD